MIDKELVRAKFHPMLVNLNIEEIAVLKKMVEERRRHVEKALAAQFNVGDSVEYDLNTGTVVSVSMEYVGIRHDDLGPGKLASVWLLGSEVSLNE